jgi:phospholipid/cholesterol/gamma-HCH transport system permease protein
MKAIANLSFSNPNQLLLQGDWTLSSIRTLDNKITRLSKQTTTEIELNGHEITAMDTAGAWIFYRLLSTLENQGKKVTVVNLSAEHLQLLNTVKSNAQDIDKVIIEESKSNFFALVGKATFSYLNNLQQWLTFTGELFISAMSLLLHPSRIRWQYFLNILERNGFRALPLVGFLSFLIGVVLTYQIGLELRIYGANIFIINLLGLATFREFAPLLSAIIIAGRTGAAFTAQLGLMKANQEIDALQTMGFSPIDLLIMPRIFGMLIAMPLLTVWADIFGVLGGMVMAKNILNISYTAFIKGFPYDVTLTTFMIGIIKAPVFALIIAAVGCFQGLNVAGSAESIGLQTTKSVVLAIFLIILADAAFSIVLTWLNI